MVLPTFAETKVGRTEGYQLQFEKPILDSIVLNQ